MRGFSAIFLLFFLQLGWGGLAAVAATPFQALDRAFYKSTAGVLFVIALIGVWGLSGIDGSAASVGDDTAAALRGLIDWFFAAAFGVYVVSLWTERQRLRARSFAAALLSGFAGVIAGAGAFYEAPFLSIETALYPMAFVLSSLLLGSVTVGMLIGHWYLIDTGQSLEPVNRIFRYFVVLLVAQSVFFVAMSALLPVVGSHASAAGLERLWRSHSTLLAMRVALGHIAPLVLSWMIWRTLLIPHTMAATGLFYIALLAVFVGDILGKQILALTGLPF